MSGAKFGADPFSCVLAGKEMYKMLWEKLEVVSYADKISVSNFFIFVILLLCLSVRDHLPPNPYLALIHDMLKDNCVLDKPRR